jgi:hypothetical protein
MTTIQDKATMIDGRWVTIPFIRTERGDRPAIPPAAIIETKSTDLTTRKDEADARRS